MSVGKTDSGKKTKRKRKRMSIDGYPVLEPNAGGMDVGAREIYVSVPPDRDEESVRICATFTEDLERMADWLIRAGVTTVAMESTGVYWMYSRYSSSAESSPVLSTRVI